MFRENLELVPSCSIASGAALGAGRGKRELCWKNCWSCISQGER